MSLAEHSIMYRKLWFHHNCCKVYANIFHFANIQGYSHDGLRSHKTIWNLTSVPKLRDFVYAVPETWQKNLIGQVLQAFEEEVIPQYDNMEIGRTPFILMLLHRIVKYNLIKTSVKYIVVSNLHVRCVNYNLNQHMNIWLLNKIRKPVPGKVSSLTLFDGHTARLPRPSGSGNRCRRARYSG